MRTGRSGAVLLETVIALAILSTAGMAFVIAAAEGANTLRRVSALERDLMRASEFLDAVALWPREDLDRHLGNRRQGPWRMQVQRISRTVYAIVLSDTLSGAALFETSLYRAEVDSVP